MPALTLAEARELRRLLAAGEGIDPDGYEARMLFRSVMRVRRLFVQRIIARQGEVTLVFDSKGPGRPRVSYSVQAEDMYSGEE